jgi:hypothetical protein
MASVVSCNCDDILTLSPSQKKNGYIAQDVYLTGNPKVTFFQAVYKRHTNFAMENIEQTVNGTAPTQVACP